MTPQGQAGGAFGVGIISSLESGLGQRVAGEQEKFAYDYNADITLQNTANEVVANQQRYAELVGRQATAYARSGVDITRGSPLLMMAATAGRGGRQAEQILQVGQEQAALDRYYGKIAAWRGNLSGIQTFLGGISKGAQQYLDTTGYIPGQDNTDYSGVDFGQTFEGA